MSICRHIHYQVLTVPSLDQRKLNIGFSGQTDGI